MFHKSYFFLYDKKNHKPILIFVKFIRVSFSKCLIRFKEDATLKSVQCKIMGFNNNANNNMSARWMESNNVKILKL